MTTKDAKVGEIYDVLEKVREEVNHKGKELTPASDEIFYMENEYVSSLNDTLQ